MRRATLDGTTQRDKPPSHFQFQFSSVEVMKEFSPSNKMAAPYFCSWRSWSVLIADQVDSLLPGGLRSLGLGVVRVVREADALDDQQLISMVPNYDVLIVSNSTRVTRPVLEAGCDGGRLKIVAKAGIGFENIDCQAAADYGIALIHTPDAYTLSAAELTCGLLMAMCRNLPQACDSMRKIAAVKMFGFGRELETPEFQLHCQMNFRNQCEWNRNAFTGVELYGKVLGIIGLGRIGLAVSRRMSSFGMNIVAYDPNVPDEVFKAACVESVPLLEVFRRSDFLSLHASYNEQTKHVVNAETLSLCKRGFCLLNCCHHGLVNEEDLILALNTGICAAAAIDVYQEEPITNMSLVGHPRIICTPGLNISTVEAKKRVSLELLERLKVAIEDHWRTHGKLETALMCRQQSPDVDIMRTMPSET